jgi:hypothetical protein
VAPACALSQAATVRDLPLIAAFGAADGRLHVHGALAALSLDELERIQKALKTAGGPWLSARGHVHQLHVQPLGGRYPAEGWGDYLLRNIAEAERIVDGGRCWYMSNPARRLAKVLHAEVRSKINAQRSNRATRTRASMPICGLQAVAPVPDKSAASYRRLSRYDATGLIWLLRGRPVVALTAATARDREPDWNVIYRRYNKPALGPLGDSLDDFA